MKNSDSAGAGVHSSLFSYYIAVGQFKSNLDAEVEAICFALEQLIYRQQKCNNVVLLVDSQTAIQSIAFNDGPVSKSIQEIRKLLKLLGRLGKKIHFQWVPSHIDLLGNNTADDLAEKGTRLQGQHNNSFNVHTLTHLIKTRSEKKVYKELSQLSQGKQWTNIDKTWKNYCTKPRKKATAMFRLNTGYDCLAACLKK
jgi:ribonuclease HI